MSKTLRNAAILIVLALAGYRGLAQTPPSKGPEMPQVLPPLTVNPLPDDRPFAKPTLGFIPVDDALVRKPGSPVVVPMTPRTVANVEPEGTLPPLNPPDHKLPPVKPPIFYETPSKQAQTPKQPRPVQLKPKDETLKADAPPKIFPLTSGPVAKDPPVATIIDDVAVFVETDLVRPRASVRHDFGNGVGYQRGFTYVEGFVPVWQAANQAVAFGVVRAVSFDASDLWEFNGGGGARVVSPLLDRVWGVNAFYDGRLNDGRFFHQVGFGLENLGPRLEVRGNVYLPVAGRRQFAQDLGFGNPRFLFSNIVLDHNRLFEVAMGGGDFEVGGPLPGIGAFQLSAYLGYYHYQAEGVPSADGIRGRLEAHVTPNMSLHFALQNDNLFNTTVTGGVALHWGGPRDFSSNRSQADILGQRVVRDVNVVIANETQTTKELAINPATGQPIIVRHAFSGAAPGGDGTVEKPYQTLAQVQAGSGPRDILFAHANSVFTKESILLQNGQRFLGEGATHLFQAQQGTFVLPRATSGTAAPVLATTFGVLLAADNEVSGLNFQNAGGGAAIVGLGNLGAFSINRNIFDGGGAGSGVVLVSTTGTGAITQNQFNNQATGVTIVHTGGALTTLLDNNTFSGGTGVVAVQTAGDMTLGVRGNNFTSGNSFVDVMAGGTQCLQLRNNTGIGDYILVQAAGLFQVEDLLATNTGTFITVGTITIVPPGFCGLP